MMTTATTMIITSVTLLTGFSSFGLLVLVAGYVTSGLLHPALDLACHRGSLVHHISERSLSFCLLFISQCSLPGFPASQTPHPSHSHYALERATGQCGRRSFWVCSGRRWASNAANSTS